MVNMYSTLHLFDRRHGTENSNNLLFNPLFRPGAASTVTVNTIKTDVMMMFTISGSGKTGTPVSSAGLGDHLQLHIWIDDSHVGKDVPLTPDLNVQ